MAFHAKTALLNTNSNPVSNRNTQHAPERTESEGLHLFGSKE